MVVKFSKFIVVFFFFLQVLSVGRDCLDVSYKNMLKYLMDTTVGGGSIRQWIYQTCTEFGFCTGHTQHTHVLQQTLLLSSQLLLFSNVQTKRVRTPRVHSHG